MRSDSRHVGGTLAKLAAAAALAALCAAAHADQDVKSSDGRWKLHAKLNDSLAVGSSAEAIIDVAPAAGGKGCPSVGQVLFEMPAHGHGGDKTPEVMEMGDCEFHVTNLSPSMDGAWRLRLVIKDGGKSSTADFNVSAK